MIYKIVQKFIWKQTAVWESLQWWRNINLFISQRKPVTGQKKDWTKVQPEWRRFYGGYLQSKDHSETAEKSTPEQVKNPKSCFPRDFCVTCCSSTDSSRSPFSISVSHSLHLYLFTVSENHWSGLSESGKCLLSQKCENYFPQNSSLRLLPTRWSECFNSRKIDTEYPQNPP